MKTVTTARSRSVILVWTFISLEHQGCLLSKHGAVGQPVLDGRSIYLFADALLPNRNYFQILAICPDGPPVFRAPGSLILRWAGGTAKVKGDRKFNHRFALTSGGEEGNGAGESVFAFRPAFHVVSCVLGNERFADHTVVKVANRE